MRDRHDPLKIPSHGEGSGFSGQNKWAETYSFDALRNRMVVIILRVMK
jgi:hypothetical protein